MFEAGMVQTLVEGVRDTLYMVLASTAFGYLLGLPLGILLCITGENGIRKNPVIYRILDIVVNLIRSVPFLILLILVSPFTKWLVGKSYGATATVVSLVIAAAPFIARMVESSLNEVDQGVIEAAKSMGATDGTIIWKVLIGEAQNVSSCRRDHRAWNDSRVLRDGGCARRRRSRRYRHPLRLLPLAGRRDVGHGYPARRPCANSARYRHAAVQEIRPQKTLTPRFSIVFVGAGDSARPWENQSKRKNSRQNRTAIGRTGSSAPTSSLILKFYFWIEMRKLNSSVVSRKMPRNTFLCEISFLRPSRKNLVQVLNRWNTDIQKALNSKRGQLNFSHIQP